jgi:hypothetical protein
MAWTKFFRASTAARQAATGGQDQNKFTAGVYVCVGGTLNYAAERCQHRHLDYLMYCFILVTCCAVLCPSGTCSRAELVQVSLIGQLVIPLLNSAGQQGGGEGAPPSPLLSLELCEAFTAAAFRPQDTVLFGK